MLARLLPATLILVTLGAGPAGAAGSLDPARALVAAGSREAARAHLDSLLASGTLPPVQALEGAYLRATLEEDGARYEEALRDLLDRDPLENLEARIRLDLGRIAFTRGEMQIALQFFRRARELGLTEEAGLWEGLTAFALGDGPAARAALEPVRQSGNRDFRQRARLALGDTYRVGENWSDARAAYRQAREEDDPGPGWWTAAALREAGCLEKMDEVDEAKSLLKKILERAPASYEAPEARRRLEILGAGSEEAATSPESEEATEGDRFSVQAGAFSVEKNAEELSGRLKARGLDAVRVVRGKDGLFRVFWGRFEDRARAEAQGDSVGADLGLGFSIVRAP